MTWAELDQAVRARGLQDLPITLLYVVGDDEDQPRALDRVEIFRNAHHGLTVLLSAPAWAHRLESDF